MGLIRVFSIFLLLGCLGIPAAGQTSAKVVKITPDQSVYKVKQGASFQVGIVLEIEEGYHINSNRPLEDFLIPTSLKLTPLTGLRISPVRYPKAKTEKFSFSDKPVSVFDGKTVLRFTVRALPSLGAGSHTLKGRLTVQACNDAQCLRPQTVDVSVPIEVSL